jgi:hypothetical protein
MYKLLNNNDDNNNNLTKSKNTTINIHIAITVKKLQDTVINLHIIVIFLQYYLNIYYLYLNKVM